jgi:hypothetical protein
MSISKFVQQNLAEMKVGYTRIINGASVTRWNMDVYEVDTWGRVENTVDAEGAAIIISNY